MKKNRLVFQAALALSLLLATSACTGGKQPPPPDPISVQLKWVHQDQFAGFYLAQDNGAYAWENLKVTFLEGGPGIDPAEAVALGQADFAVIAPEQFLIRDRQETPMKAIAAIYRRSAVMFVTKVDSGILSPFDFEGKPRPWSSQ